MQESVENWKQPGKRAAFSRHVALMQPGFLYPGYAENVTHLQVVLLRQQDHIRGTISGL